MGRGLGVRIDLDALMAFPLEEVERILRVTKRGSRRRRKLPAHVMVYYVIALGLLTSVGAREVLRRVLHREAQDFSFTLATDVAITKARQRLGWAPLKRLFEDYVRPIATRRMAWAWFKGRRLVAMDGSTLNVIDSRDNVRVFGKPPSSRGKTVFAQIRWVALAEVGTHVLFAARMAGWRVSEYAMGLQLLRYLTPGMLCLADRLFYGFEMWSKAAETGADLLWRVQKNIPLPRLRTLKDRSYLSEVRPRSTERKKVRERSIPVRVVEFDATVRGHREHYRLITTLLNPRQATAMELAQLYAKRWKIETIFDEIKDHRRGGGTAVALRSKRPDLVRQDFYGLLLAHFGVRSLMLEAAQEAGVEPGCISFTHAMNVVIRRLPEMVSFPPSLEAALP
jgi:transposase IS4-like protein/DDE family transposase